MNGKDFSALYSVYSWPNVILVFFGGLAGDYFGLRIASLFFCTFVVAGTVLVAIGPTFFSPENGYLGKQAWGVMMAGRVLLGVGGESLNVIQTSMIVRWFSSTTFMATAFGFALSMSRLGSTVAIFFGKHVGYKRWLWLGAAFTGISLIAILIYSLLDRISEKHIERKPQQKEKINIKAVLSFDKRFWFIAALTTVYYACVTPFIGLLASFLSLKYFPDNDFMVSVVSTIINMASMILAPFLGKVVDTVGRRPYFILGGSLLLLPAHFLLAWPTPLGTSAVIPVLPVVMIGLSFSLVPAALWPSIPLVIDSENTATAYGLMTSIQNIGLAIVNIITGALIDISTEVFMVLFLSIDLVGIILSCLLIYYDHKKGGQLCATRDAKKEKLSVEAINPSNYLESNQSIFEESD